MTNKSDKILAPIKRRVVEFIENQQIEKKFFFKNLGVASSNFRGQALYSEVSADIIAKILSLYPNSNAEWFLLGNGEMLKTNTVIVPNDDCSRYKELAEERAYTIQMQRQVIENLQQELKQHKKNTQSTMPDVLHQSTR
nr:MAG TPA: sigma factor [Caudoviricetes sp.]